MKRRTFLMVATAMAAGGAGAAAVERRVGLRNLGRELHRLEGFGRPLAERLRAHYHWIGFDPAAFEEYLDDYSRRFGRLNRFSIPDRDFFTRFLLSTDYFVAGVERAPGDDPVRYVMYADGAACYNPFAQPPPTDAELAERRRLA